MVLNINANIMKLINIESQFNNNSLITFPLPARSVYLTFA